MNDRPLFILAGNGPYLNRGCEAIVRGTVKILRQQFVDPQFICISHFNSRKEYESQRENEIDDSIQHLSSYRLDKYDAISTFYKSKTWKYIYRSFLRDKKIGYSIYGDILPYLPKANAVLSIGGDNYSLDYGKPGIFTSLDDLILEIKKPLIIWGASVGPFDNMPDYEEYMRCHLQKVTGIYARESATIDYLKSIGVTKNVYKVADPAFLMEPINPGTNGNNLTLNEEAIGLNLSPLMAKYVTDGNLEKWTRIASSIIDAISQKTGMSIYLIPHVTIPASNDYVFMQRALSLIENAKGDVILVPPKYNAAETKWIISQMTLFAGSRTHSTISALSSGVPTLSLAYSMKAQGINRDIFGHSDYCLEPSNIQAGIISDHITSMLDNKARIRRALDARMKEIKGIALSAGTMLKYLIEEK